MNKEDRKREIANYTPIVEIVVDDFLSHSSRMHYRYMRDDMVSEGYIALTRAVDKFDEGRGVERVTYYSAAIRGHLKNVIRSERATERHIVYTDLENLNSEEVSYDVGSFELIDKFEPEDEIDKAIYHQIFMGGETYRSVGDEFGLKRKTVESRARRLKKKLKEQMEKDLC